MRTLIDYAINNYHRSTGDIKSRWSNGYRSCLLHEGPGSDPHIGKTHSLITIVIKRFFIEQSCLQTQFLCI